MSLKSWPLHSDKVSFAVTETGAHLSDVVFTLAEGRRVTPMHTSPWEDELLPADLPPILRILRGDFFCAPFAESNVIASEKRAHGLTANGKWRMVNQTDHSLDLALEGDVMGASVVARYKLQPGHNVVYQRHIITGGSGRIPMGHHAMLRAGPELKLGFGPHVFSGTPPTVPEEPPQGRSILAYPQEIADLHKARMANGLNADLTTYPFAEGHEDLWMISADRTQPLGWSAATCSADGWVWFALKDPKVLPSTTLWLSNGGRTYSPWLSRHRHVIGIEEVCSYFASGHAASIADNPLSQRGIPTAFDLKPDGHVVISYIFGVAPVPHEFGAVTEIRADGDGIILVDGNGMHARAAVDLSHLSTH